MYVIWNAGEGWLSSIGYRDFRSCLHVQALKLLFQVHGPSLAGAVNSKHDILAPNRLDCIQGPLVHFWVSVSAWALGQVASNPSTSQHQAIIVASIIQ